MGQKLVDNIVIVIKSAEDAHTNFIFQIDFRKLLIYIMLRKWFLGFFKMRSPILQIFFDFRKKETFVEK